MISIPEHWIEGALKEQDAKMTMEQGAEENDLGSMERTVCHKIIVFYTIENFRLASLGISTQKYTKSYQFYTSGQILIQGSNSQISKEQGDTKID